VPKIQRVVLPSGAPRVLAPKIGRRNDKCIGWLSAAELSFPAAGEVVDARFFLQKAQEAEAIANASVNTINRRHWENLAKEYRQLAREAVNQPAQKPTQKDQPK
jgi:hypothetical protein